MTKGSIDQQAQILIKETEIVNVTKLLKEDKIPGKTKELIAKLDLEQTTSVLEDLNKSKDTHKKQWVKAFIENLRPDQLIEPAAKEPTQNTEIEKKNKNSKIAKKGDAQTKSHTEERHLKIKTILENLFTTAEERNAIKMSDNLTSMAYAIADDSAKDFGRLQEYKQYAKNISQQIPSAQFYANKMIFMDYNNHNHEQLSGFINQRYMETINDAQKIKEKINNNLKSPHKALILEGIDSSINSLTKDKENLAENLGSQANRYNRAMDYLKEDLITSLSMTDSNNRAISTENKRILFKSLNFNIAKEFMDMALASGTTFIGNNSPLRSAIQPIVREIFKPDHDLDNIAPAFLDSVVDPKKLGSNILQKKFAEEISKKIAGYPIKHIVHKAPEQALNNTHAEKHIKEDSDKALDSAHTEQHPQKNSHTNPRHKNYLEQQAQIWGKEVEIANVTRSLKGGKISQELIAKLDLSQAASVLEDLNKSKDANKKRWAKDFIEHLRPDQLIEPATKEQTQNAGIETKEQSFLKVKSSLEKMFTDEERKSIKMGDGKTYIVDTIVGDGAQALSSPHTKNPIHKTSHTKPHPKENAIVRIFNKALDFLDLGNLGVSKASKKTHTTSKQTSHKDHYTEVLKHGKALHEFSSNKHTTKQEATHKAGHKKTPSRRSQA